MERPLTEKESEMIINFGAFGYPADKCAIVLGWDISEVDWLMKNTESEFYQRYQQGKIKADYVIDLKLFEMAQSGDLRSLAKWEERTKDWRDF